MQSESNLPGPVDSPEQLNEQPQEPGDVVAETTSELTESEQASAFEEMDADLASSADPNSDQDDLEQTDREQSNSEQAGEDVSADQESQVGEEADAPAAAGGSEPVAPAPHTSAPQTPEPAAIP